MTKAEKIERIKTSKPVRPLDFIIFALLIILTAALFIAAYSSDEEPNYVRIYYNNDALKELKLDKDDSYQVKDENGNTLLTVDIKDGIVTVTDSACPDHICEMTRIKSAGFQIICLPNGIVIKITGSSWFDGIVG